jgi:hypothetical protein
MIRFSRQGCFKRKGFLSFHQNINFVQHDATVAG